MINFVGISFIYDQCGNLYQTSLSRRNVRRRAYGFDNIFTLIPIVWLKSVSQGLIFSSIIDGAAG